MGFGKNVQIYNKIIQHIINLANLLYIYIFKIHNHIRKIKRRV